MSDETETDTGTMGTGQGDGAGADTSAPVPASVEKYGEGIVIRGPGGRFLPGSKTPKPITVQNSHEYARKRQEKARAALRAALLDETKGAGVMLRNLPVSGSAEAIAAAGGMLWSEIVLNSDAYPRDRLEAWVKIGKAAGILDADQEADAGGGSENLLTKLGADVARRLLDVLERRQGTGQGTE